MENTTTSSKPWALLFSAFVLGFATMALEISAARLFAPFFGTSALVWTNVIGVVLVSLSLGYWLGGKLSETTPNSKTLSRLLLCGSLVIALVGLLGPQVLKYIETLLLPTGLTYVLTGSLLSALILFGPPIFLAGMASPYLVTLGVSSSHKLGATVGTFYAVSTIGGLLGTFLPTLVLVPSIGTLKTIYLSGLTLAVSGVLLSKSKTLTTSMPTLCLVSLILFGLQLHGPTFNQEKLVSDAESVYQHISITEDKEGVRYLKFDSGLSIQSVYNPKEIQNGYYYDAYSIFPALIDKPHIRILIMGFAGGTIARQMTHYYGDTVNITGVELDKEVVALAEKNFGLEKGKYELYYQDARQALNTLTENYDIVIVDTYHNEFQIPWQMTTQEFWQATRKRLAPGGYLLMNIAHLGKDSFLVNALANTATTTYSFVYTAQSQPNFHGNTMLVARDSEIVVDSAKNLNPDLLPLVNTLVSTVKKISFSESLPLLTDDNASMEWLLWQDLLQASQKTSI